MKKMIVNSILALGVLVTLNAADMEIQCKSPIQSFSNMDKMGDGDFSANVQWKDVKLSPLSLGYGPGAHKQYELTIVDGKVYMARPDDSNGIIVRNDPQPNEGAAMLQVITPSNLTQYSTLDEIGSSEELNFELDDIVENSNCKEDAILGFKIKGFAKSLTWSMDTENHKIITSKNKEIELVGIYTKKDKSKYFMVKGTNSHIHVISRKENIAGHVRNVVLNEGAKLYLTVK